MHKMQEGKATTRPHAVVLYKRRGGGVLVEGG